jgi:hypothetical protein
VWRKSARKAASVITITRRIVIVIAMGVSIE